VIAHSTRKIGKFLSIAVIAIIALSACAQSGTPNGNGGGNQTLPPIKIGASLAITGDRAPDGKAIQQGYELWRDDINKRGGLLGRQVVLDIVSDNSDAKQVVTNYKKLISVDKVDLVLGPFSSALTFAGAPVVDSYGYAYIAGTGGIDKIYNLHLKTYFNVSLPIRSYLDTFADYMLSLPQDKRPKTAAYIGEDNPFVTLQLPNVQKKLEAGGITTVLSAPPYPEETTDYTALVQKVVNSKADIVVLGTHVADAVAFVKGFKQNKFNPMAIIATGGPDGGKDFYQPIGGTQVAEGIFVPNGGWFDGIKTYQNDVFTQEYLAKYGGTMADMNSGVMQAYSVGQILEQAVKAANSVDNAKVIAALHSDTTFNSLQGPVKFDADGANTLAVPFLFQWQQGKLIVVYPANSAQALPQFPKSPWPA